ncbi:hypothetical protein [Nocardioides sp. zg-1228]|uniref:hypothetical protein n=1 Tax=Nocardioides sp. zg-1228 TaxID=2763008 RepID=UPI00164360D9|nr:hypothetical protein [Nocardioides sp. zg-1228]MBC2934792.1 hypothetical protein [Nocardioides sp. zg-1228]QSF58417.1 hypothetical protein JX575_04205 [Nocardioides sp. zg-1228]
MMSRGERVRLVAACVGLVAVLASGCQSSGEGTDADPVGGSPTSSSAPPTPVPTATSTVVEPADGPRIKVPGASMHGLATYTRNSDFGIVQGFRDGQSGVTLAPALTDTASLDAFAKEWIRQHDGPKVQVRQDDAVAGGKYNAWHVVDETSDPQYRVHTFGVMFLDSSWTITIRHNLDGVPQPLTDDEMQGVTDSLLASFKTDLD